MSTAFAPLQMWEAEGGSQVVPADAATTLTPADEVLLRRLGPVHAFFSPALPSDGGGCKTQG
ncbi:MAG: hypothetical protein KGQ77_09185, partial [Betaproteobacteria bacterium]|nr:hypothetical protein [Betaproteobacteria bacterium]